MEQPRKSKPAKPAKLDSIPKINRRLFALWSIKVRDKANQTCAYCGIKKGDIRNGKPLVKIDAHHLISRYKKDCPLKFDIKNGIPLCPKCHKFSPDSFHKSPVTTIAWLIENRKESFDYVMKYKDITLNLKDRDILKSIEDRLENGIDLEDMYKGDLN